MYYKLLLLNAALLSILFIKESRNVLRPQVSLVAVQNIRMISPGLLMSANNNFATIGVNYILPYVKIEIYFKL